MGEMKEYIIKKMEIQDKMHEYYREKTQDIGIDIC